jgi:hypothetical protein
MNKASRNKRVYRSIKEFKERFFSDEKDEHLVNSLKEAEEYGAAMARESVSKIKLNLTGKSVT